VIRAIIAAIAVLSLAVCLAAPVFFFLGRIDTPGYRNILLAGTIGWFLCAALLAGRRRNG
jgi:hypothetical protein